MRRYNARMNRRYLFKVLCLVTSLVGLPIAVDHGSDAQAKSTEAQVTVHVDELPSNARTTLKLIKAGGPFPYERDGVVFQNRERAIPDKPRGYYHEFTVKTPGSHDRGARRIVCGGESQSLDDCYYSDDHYRSFRKIVR